MLRREIKNIPRPATVQIKKFWRTLKINMRLADTLERKPLHGVEKAPSTCIALNSQLHIFFKPGKKKKPMKS